MADVLFRENRVARKTSHKCFAADVSICRITEKPHVSWFPKDLVEGWNGQWKWNDPTAILNRILLCFAAQNGFYSPFVSTDYKRSLTAIQWTNCKVSSFEINGMTWQQNSLLDAGHWRSQDADLILSVLLCCTVNLILYLWALLA